MIDKLVQELRSYPEHYTAAHRAADALEKREYYNCRLEDALVAADLDYERLRDHIEEQQLDIVTLGQEVGRLREALDYYAKNHYPNVNDGPWGANSTDFGDVARAALGEEKK
jgi:hypothetical protein